MVTSLWSSDVRVACRPFASYARMGRETPAGWWQIGGAALRWLLFVACCVSWTSSGELLVEHLVFSPWAWSFVPLGQGLAVGLAARSLGERSGRRVLGLYFAGHFPWLAALLAAGGVCLLSSNPARLLRWLLLSGVLPALLLVAVGWCILLTYAMFRAGIGWSRRRSACATLLHYALATLLFGSWFLVTGQLLPLWGLM